MLNISHLTHIFHIWPYFAARAQKHFALISPLAHALAFPGISPTGKMGQILDKFGFFSPILHCNQQILFDLGALNAAFHVTKRPFFAALPQK